jgi:hypothetical protein
MLSQRGPRNAASAQTRNAEADLLTCRHPKGFDYRSRPSSLFFLQGILDKNNITNGATNV